MSIVLSEPFALLAAARYGAPVTAGDLLPEVYGDFSAGGGSGSVGPAPCPAVQIDKPGFVFCACARPVASISDVYVNLTRQTSGFTVNLSNNYQSLGPIATITFTAQPTGAVTWRGTGIKDASGALIENCADQIKDLLLTRGGFATADLNLGAFAEAAGAVTTLGYKTAWVIRDQAQVGQWLTEMLFNVLGSWRINGQKQLEIRVDTGAWSMISDLVANIVASRDCENCEDGVTFTMDLIDVVNALNINYGWLWGADNKAGFQDTTQGDVISQSAIGTFRRTVNLRGQRTAAQVATWASILFARQSFRTRVEGAKLQFTILGGKLAHAAIGDPLGFSWPGWGPTRESSNPYVNEILRIAAINHDPMNGGRTTVVGVDTGAYIVSNDYFDAAVTLDGAVLLGGTGRVLSILPWEGAVQL